ncbi:MAG: circadian clock KaiB family protein [Cyanobacteriota bacterium]|nr:circadian clock KaiB family protein [Cyanobacteriota bacterium]
MRDRLPPFFKGIALFTPGGDLIYCIDPGKRDRWHFHLCAALQDLLGLSETPHFLVPGYTATLDRWRNPKTGKVETFAEMYPPVQRHQALLNAVFEAENTIWQVAPWQESSCEPAILDTYRAQFPQLWEERDLIVNYAELEPSKSEQAAEISLLSLPSTPSLGYVLRLFVSGDSVATEQTLRRVHHLLEEGLHSPYTLKIIDVYKHPEQAELNQVSAIPTLMRVFPEPVRRIVGDLDDTQRVLQILTGD